MTSPSVSTADTPHPENRLAHESSPYLLQHRHNPVDWYPWGEEAFAKARAEQKPLLISIGYSACHWCHVMERESFEDAAIAEVMNSFLVCVKVDREERPDVDAIYMDVCQAMTGQGGWPLNVFATPNLKPFFAGTYFPPDGRYGRASWRTVLDRIREAWALDRASLVEQADHLHREIERVGRLAPRKGTVDADILAQAVSEAQQQFDSRNGGFGDAPKFPPDTRLALLLAASDDLDNGAALQMVTRTLDAMAYGGMYDQVGGGFARYSVDAQWLIPHFEKMLYNQALLVPVYADAFLVTEKPLYRRVVVETLDWVLRDLRSEEGAFFCALDADSEGEEGKYYVWTPPQIEEILGAEDGSLFSAYYGITGRGNFEHGTSNPNVVKTPEAFAAGLGVTEEAWLARLEAMKVRVREARVKRVPPGLDDKCLTGWNGLMLTALCRGWQALGEARWLEAARRAADFLLEKQWAGAAAGAGAGGALRRSWCKGRSTIDGLLDDYAYLANGLIDLYESCFERRYLDAARELAEAAVSSFGDAEHGGFYYTSGKDASLISRTREDHDGALPAAPSVAALALLRLGALFGREDLTAAGVGAVEASASQVNRVPQAFASLLLAHRFATGPSPQVVIAAGEGESVSRSNGHVTEGVRELLEAAWRTYLPGRTLALADAAADLPLTDGKKAIAGQPTAYVCIEFSCQAPMTSPEAVREQLLNLPRATRQ